MHPLPIGPPRPDGRLSGAALLSPAPPPVQRGMSPGHVILLNGAPSVGKSSTARALQELLTEPHYYLGLDEYRRGYLDRVWLADDGALFRRMIEPFLRNLATLARAGHGVIAESMLTPAEVASQILPVLADPPQPSGFERLRRQAALRA